MKQKIYNTETINSKREKNYLKKKFFVCLATKIQKATEKNKIKFQLKLLQKKNETIIYNIFLIIILS